MDLKWISLRLLTMLSLALAGLTVLPESAEAQSPGGSAAIAAAVPLYQDDFQDGDFTHASGPNGLTWSVVAGHATVDSIGGSLQLGVDRGDSLIVTDQRIPSDDYTLRFDGSITWSAPGRVVVLYKDANNYYSVGLGSQTGIYRRLNGVETQLHEDPEDLVRLPHAGLATGAFKVYAHNTGQAVVVRADKAGDGVDYDIEIVDTNPTAVATFKNTGVGMLSAGGTPEPPWFYCDNVKIYSGMVLDPYTPVTYYVDKSHPQANDTNPGTESLPWKTIQKAANSVRAGDTVIVKAGTYNERITFNSGIRGAPGQVITFKSQPRRSATMWGFYTQFAHYLRIEGFNITTDASLTGWTEQNGVFISSDHVQVVDNYLYNLRSTAISGTSVGALVSGNRIYHSQAGIAVSGSGWLVEGNEVERLFDLGGGDSDYARFFGDDHVFRRNFFHGTVFSEIGSAHVDCFQTFDNNGEYAHRILFDGNVCYDFHQGLMGEAAYYHNISDLTFRNNIFAHGGAWGLCVMQIKNVVAVHNVFADIQYHGMGFRDGASGVVRNNIFYNAGSNYWASDGGTVTGSHNLLFETGGTIPAGDFPDDLVNLDPKFVSAAGDDYHLLAGSPAIDAGMDVGVLVDRDGAPRPQGKRADIGAYEFTPALVLGGAANDRSISLVWQVNSDLPPAATWLIEYLGPGGDQPSPVSNIPLATRTYTLTGLTNYQRYTITVSAMDGSTRLMSESVTLMPSNLRVYLGLTRKALSP